MKKLKFIVLSMIFVTILGLGACSSNTPTPDEIEVTPELTNEDAKEILYDLLPRAEYMYSPIFNGVSINIDETQLMPGDDRFALLVDYEYSSLAQLKEDIESIFTKEVAEEEFYSRYIDSDDGLSMPLYKEYEGQLYQNIHNGGKGWATDWLIETAVIKSQEGTRVTIEMETTLFDEPFEPLTVVMEYIDGKWLIAEPLV